MSTSETIGEIIYMLAAIVTLTLAHAKAFSGQYDRALFWIAMAIFWTLTLIANRINRPKE